MHNQPVSFQGELRLFSLDREKARKTKTNAFKLSLLREDWQSSTLGQIGAIMRGLRSWQQFL
jgi:hypothetical protein